MVLLNCSGGLEIPLGLLRGSQGISQVAKRESSLLLSCKGELGIALKSLQGTWASSRIKERNAGVFSHGFSCGRKPGVPLELRR